MELNSKQQIAVRSCGIFCYVIAAALIVLMFITCLDGGVWLDEAFSYAMVEKGYWEIAQLTARDVHPPLYYWILKFCIDFTSLFNGATESRIAVGKAVSVLPYIFLWIYSLVFVRKDFGWLTSGIFVLVIIGMPNLFHYGSETRMYSWSLAFVMAAFFHLYHILKNIKDIPSWVAFSVYTLLAAYTQYFAFLSVFFLWFGLFLWMLIKHRKEWRYFVVAAVITVVLYLPWMIFLVQQLGAHYYGDINFGALHPDNVLHYYNFTFKFVFGGWIFSVLVFLLCLLVLIFSILRFRMDEVNWMAVIGIGTHALVMLVLSVLPAIVSHDVYDRYIFPAVGCLWYPVVVMAYRLIRTAVSEWREKPNRKGRACVLPILRLCVTGLLGICLLIGGAGNVQAAYAAARIERNAHSIVQTEVFDRIEKGDYVISENALYALPVISTFCPDATYFSYRYSCDLAWVLTRIGYSKDIDQFEDYLKNGDVVWVFDSGFFPQEDLQSLEEFCFAEQIPFSEIGYYNQVDTIGVSCMVYRLG